MNEQELRQRAVLAALPECIRFATDHPTAFNVGTGFRVITDEAMHNAVNNAVKISEILIKKLKKQELEMQSRKKAFRDYYNLPVKYCMAFNKKQVESLEQAGLKTIADIVRCNERDLLSMKYIGKSSLADFERILELDNLHLGMDISEYMEDKE